jgi:hypothetical protein
MNKAVSLGAAILAALAASVASADNGKHFGRGHVNAHYRPVYVAPAPVRPHYYAPAPVRSYYAPARGYWRNGRWIAPVVVGAAIGGIAIAATAPSYGYVAPAYYAPPVTVSYAAPSYASPAGFDYADVSGDGFITYEEAAVHPHWQRNFGLIDRNHDGYLSREEVIGWRLH